MKIVKADKLKEAEIKEVKEEEVKEEKKPEIVPEKINDKKPVKTFLLVFFLGLLLGGVLTGGIGFYYYTFYYMKGKVVQDIAVTPTPTEILSPIPEKTIQEIDYSKYTVQILNGSGVAGVAGKVKELIVPLGFENIETGNAEKLGFTQTEIQLKEGVPDEVYEKVVEKLTDYEVTKSGVLDETEEYDLIITVGVRE